MSVFSCRGSLNAVTAITGARDVEGDETQFMLPPGKEPLPTSESRPSPVKKHSRTISTYD